MFIVTYSLEGWPSKGKEASPLDANQIFNVTGKSGTGKFIEGILNNVY